MLADKGYADAGEHIRTPYKGRNEPESLLYPTAPHTTSWYPVPRTVLITS